jgi:hypothetical protein
MIINVADIGHDGKNVGAGSSARGCCMPQNRERAHSRKSENRSGGFFGVCYGEHHWVNFFSPSMLTKPWAIAPRDGFEADQ